MKKNTSCNVSPAYYTEQSTDIQFTEPEFSELYKKAFLENDYGDSNKYCQNTTSWE